MSNHISADIGDIAESILLPGDPLRAKYIAETFLEKVFCYNEIRGMLGYTGFYKGKKISVQGTGMGIPSISIYTNELIQEYNVKKLIRVGTCGAIQDYIKLRDIIIALSASTDSNTNKITFPGFDYSPTANFNLLDKAYMAGKENNRLGIHVGSVLTTDTFYSDDLNAIKKFAEYGVLAVEMEVAALYKIAAKFNVAAIALLTVSDHIFREESTSAKERQSAFYNMVEIALETLI